ncbi:MAG: hypothetical protein H0X71_10205 [Rubrobacter sp.]|nr:hypothetical protein [Rubrobacter sp.]
MRYRQKKPWADAEPEQVDRDRRTFFRACYTGGVVEDAQQLMEEEKARIEARYREVLKNSVAFERKIRNRWREKNRQKNIRIAELEARVAELEHRLQDAES